VGEREGMADSVRVCIGLPPMLDLKVHYSLFVHEKEIELKPFWQCSSLHSMFFTSDDAELVE